jgi:hypothetical protein
MREPLRKGTIVIGGNWRGRVDADYDGIVSCFVDGGGYKTFSRASVTIIGDNAIVGNCKLATCGRKSSAGCGMKNPVLWHRARRARQA